jgi:hypothetical protein
MEEAEKQQLVARAQLLEKKQFFVKAAEIYLRAGLEEQAAKAYESGSAYDKAAGLFKKLGKEEDARRCQAKRDAGATGQTWQDLQSEFQQDKGNPY